MESAYTHAQTALTLFAAFCGILLIVLAVPPTRYWAAGAVYRGDHRIAAVAVAMLAFVAGVLVVPLGRTLFELTALPVWQYLAIFGLAVVWSQLCLLVWRTGLLDRWLGTATDPGNLCAMREAAADEGRGGGEAAA